MFFAAHQAVLHVLHGLMKLSQVQSRVLLENTTSVICPPASLKAVLPQTCPRKQAMMLKARLFPAMALEVAHTGHATLIGVRTDDVCTVNLDLQIKNAWLAGHSPLVHAFHSWSLMSACMSQAMQLECRLRWRPHSSSIRPEAHTAHFTAVRPC